MSEVPIYSWSGCFTEMCSGSEAGSYLRLIAFVYHSTLGLRVIKKRRRSGCRHLVLLMHGLGAHSEYGTCKAVKARFRPWLSGKFP